MGKDNPDGRQLNRRTEFRIVRRVGAVKTTPSSIKTTAAAANPMPIMTFSKTEHDFGQAKAGRETTNYL